MKPSLQLKIAVLIGYVLLCTMLLTAQPDEPMSREGDANARAEQIFP